MSIKNANKIGLFHLTMIGLAGIIGSGWLFASMYVSNKAQTGAYFSWILGSLIMFTFCMCLSELSNIYPARGLLASICSFSHNKDFSFIVSLANWLGTVCVIPSEALATTRYLSWSNHYVIPLIFFYSLLNSWGIKIFSKFNSPLTIFKLFVPITTAIVFLIKGTHVTHINYHDITNYHAILKATLTGGVIYAFNGIQMIVNYSSETKNPSVNIPRALFLALGIGLMLHLSLQKAFLSISDANQVYNSPFIQLATSLNLAWLIMILQVDATVSPSGTGFMYIGTCTRMLKAMSREGQMPKIFNVLHPKYQISHNSLIANTILALILFSLLQTWEGLVAIVSVFHLISYLAGPIALSRLRITMPNKTRLFKMPLHNIICPLLFIILSILFIQTGFEKNLEVTSVCCAFLFIYLIINYKKNEFIPALKRSSFFPIWLITFTIISYINPNIIFTGIISYAIYYIGVYKYNY